MECYKCLSDDYHTWKQNGVYSKDSMDGTGVNNITVYVKDNPHHWELVTSDYEVY